MVIMAGREVCFVSIYITCLLGRPHGTVGKVQKTVIANPPLAELERVEGEIRPAPNLN